MTNPPPPSQDLPWKTAIDQVLAEAKIPLHYNEIAQTIVDKGLRTNIGATPATTVHTLLSSSLKRDGDASPYLRVARGIYSLKPQETLTEPQKKNEQDNWNEEEKKTFQLGVQKLGSQSPEWQEKKRQEEIETEWINPWEPPLKTPEKHQTQEEEEPDILTSFGMFWRRDAIEWARSPKLLGMSQLGGTPVDFCNQIGLYLLYDGREVIYAGRSTERPLGRRLYEHTLDRLSTRWNRFSWFGLLPVSEEGLLGKLPPYYPALALIPAFEAVLIEALEPRQNRKRGDDLAAVEYLQKISPEIEKRRVKDQLDRALNKLYEES